MRTFLGLLVACSLALAVGAQAKGPIGAKPEKPPRATQPAQPPQFPALPGNWSHAEINVKIRGVPHTLILDRGRIVRLSPLQLTLREADASMVTVPLSADTIVTFRGFGRRAKIVRRGLFALTMRIDDGAAVRVRVSLRP